MISYLQNWNSWALLFLQRDCFGRQIQKDVIELSFYKGRQLPIRTCFRWIGFLHTTRFCSANISTTRLQTCWWGVINRFLSLLGLLTWPIWLLSLDYIKDQVFCGLPQKIADLKIKICQTIANHTGKAVQNMVKPLKIDFRSCVHETGSFWKFIKPEKTYAWKLQIFLRAFQLRRSSQRSEYLKSVLFLKILYILVVQYFIRFQRGVNYFTIMEICVDLVSLSSNHSRSGLWASDIFHSVLNILICFSCWNIFQTLLCNKN